MSENPWEEAMASCDKCLGPLPTFHVRILFRTTWSPDVFCSDECLESALAAAPEAFL